MSRRGILMAVMASATARAGPGGARFVLVHGAWHGGWCWEQVVSGLTARHEVKAPTLKGLAERAAELTPELSLTTHAQDVVTAVGDWREVTLVGHSYGGLVISHALSLLEGRVARLVYLDAFLPSPGQKGFDLMKPQYSESWRKRAKRLAVPPMLSAKAMGIDDAALAKVVDAKLTPHPLGTFDEKVQYDEAAWMMLDKHYVLAARYPGFKPTAARAKALGLTVHELDAGHDVMLAAPAALVALLERIVGR